MTKKKLTTLNDVKAKYRDALLAKLQAYNPDQLIHEEVKRMTISAFSSMLGVENTWGRPEFMSDSKMTPA